MLFHVEINGKIITETPLAFTAAQGCLMANLGGAWGRLVRVQS